MAKSHDTPITDEARAILNGKVKPIPDSDLLEKTEQYIRRYVVLPEVAYLPIALWAIATHAVLRFDVFPYLAAVSAVKRSGKTRLAEVLETVTRQPWRGTAPSPAAVYRYLENAPTLLLDETEPLNTKNKSEMTQILLAVLNMGYRKGASVLKCDGTDHKPRRFPVYGPKMFAAIGHLPDTLMDRSIVIHMQRRTKSQKVGRFLQARISREVKPLHDSIVQFAQIHRTLIDEAYQLVIDQDLEYLSDRDAEVWMPLFTLCAVLKSERLEELRKCAEALSGTKAENDVDDNWLLTLQRDIRSIWPKENDMFNDDNKAEICETSELLTRLNNLPESPWAEHPLTAHRLARMLKPFGIVPHQIRVGDRKIRGYIYSELKDVFDRYLDDQSGTSGTTQ